MYLAIDYGKKRVGVAVGEKIAFSRGFYNNDAELIPSLSKLIREEGVEIVVFGIPEKDSGLPGELTKEIKLFAGRLQKVEPVRVVFENESDTTSSANQKLKDAGVDIKSSKGHVDGLAAAEILEQYINSQ